MREKGCKAGKYLFLLIIFWIGGEFTGAIVGTLLSSGKTSWLTYVFALIGAAIAVNIAKGASPDTSAVLQPISTPSITARIDPTKLSIEERLRRVDELRIKNLINDQELQNRRQQILNDL